MTVSGNVVLVGGRNNFAELPLEERPPFFQILRLVCNRNVERVAFESGVIPITIRKIPSSLGKSEPVEGGVEIGGPCNTVPESVHTCLLIMPV